MSHRPNQWSQIAAKHAAIKPAEQTLVVRECDSATPTDLSYFVEKKDFGNGAIRIFVVDTYGEPACCSSHVVIYFPVGDEPGDKCFHLASSSDGAGFMSTSLKDLKASYDEKAGLSLKLPVSFYDVAMKSSDEMSKRRTFEVFVNRKTQVVSAKPVTK